MALSAMQLLPLGLRGFQFGFSLLALITIAAGFRSNSGFGLSSMLGSHATNFAMLMTYTTTLYALYDALAVEHFQAVPRVAPRVQLGLNAGFAAILFITGIVLATSDYVRDCDAYTMMLRCGSLTAGTVFTFLAMASFIGSAALPFISFGAPSKTPDENMEAIPYVQEETPKGALSPIGTGAENPSSRV